MRRRRRRRRRPGQNLHHQLQFTTAKPPPLSLSLNLTTPSSSLEPLSSLTIPRSSPHLHIFVSFQQQSNRSNRIESCRRWSIGCGVVAAGARIDVDVSVPEAADGEHHAMGVERRARDGARLGGRQERGVGLDGVDAGAIDVEEGEGVRVGASGFFLLKK